ncbi:MAG: DUF1800 family protein [Planctomycetota bacterium]
MPRIPRRVSALLALLLAGVTLALGPAHAQPAASAPNQSLALQVTASAFVGTAPLTVRFDALAPDQPHADLPADAFRWTVNRKPVGHGARFSHDFTTPGTHHVRVYLTVPSHPPATQSITITIAEKPWQSGGSITEAEARRFLWQAAFGPTADDVQYVRQHGYAAWIDRQLELPASLLTERLARSRGRDEDGYFFTPGLVDDLFVGAPDQLRQRTAWALSQVIPINAEVAIDNEELYNRGTRDLFNIFLRHALPSSRHRTRGSYEDLLVDLTFNSAMATWLTYKNSTKASREFNTKPDENYAREVMQLFTIGMVRLNPDGSLVLDAEGRTIPNYSNRDVKNFARVFTGMIDGRASREEPFEASAEPVNWLLEDHDFGAKQLLVYPGVYPKRGVIPAAPRARQSQRRAEAEVQAAIRNLIFHPSHPPFLAHRMIQRFTTSNPSPGYVRRVAEAYQGKGPFGDGRRGDLAAMIRAILLDDEARNPVYRSNPHHGVVLEPMRLMVGVARAHSLHQPAPLLPTTDMELVWEMTEITGQGFLDTTSVFNFYLPDFSPPGTRLRATGMAAPELQILDDYRVMAGLGYMCDTAVHLIHEFNEPLTERAYTQAHNPRQLVETLVRPLDHGWLTPRQANALARALRRIRNPEMRVYALVYLTLGNPEFRVLR